MNKISICIPTYNRGKYLHELMNCIMHQLYEDSLENEVEIVISDNASSDNTSDIVASFVDENPTLNIQYHCNKENIGADGNFLKVVEIATGEYCWIVGSDDLICEGSIKRILKEIQEKHTIYLCNRYNCTKDTMEIINSQTFLRPEITSDTVFRFRNDIEWDYYFNMCENIGGVFSYLTSVIFSKKEWDAVTDYKSYIGNSFIHVVKLLKALQLNNEKASVKYIVDPLVKNRKENDSFKVNELQRLMLDYKGYLLFSELFKNEIVSKELRLILLRTHPVISNRILLRYSSKELTDLFDTMKKIGYPDAQIKMQRKLAKHKVAFTIINLDKVFKHFKHRR